jgi:hypothetical protein
LSYNSFFISDDKIKNNSIPNLANISYQDEQLYEILRFFGNNNSENNQELGLIFSNFDNVINFLCYFGLYSEYNLNKFKTTVDSKDYSSFIDVLLNKIGPNIQKEGGILAMMKILQNYVNLVNHY